MKFSLGKTVWIFFSKILTIAFWLFLIFDLATLFFIFSQENFDWNQFFGIFTAIILIFSLGSWVISFRPWLQLIYFPPFLFFYYKYGYQILYSLPLGIHYNFLWSLPETISNVIGFSGQRKVIDFIFWSGFIFTSWVFVLQLQWWVLGFLAGRKVAFAAEIWKEEKAKLIEAKRKYLEVQTGVKPFSKKQKILRVIFYLFFIFLLSGLIILTVFLWSKKI